MIYFGLQFSFWLLSGKTSYIVDILKQFCKKNSGIPSKIWKDSALFLK